MDSELLDLHYNDDIFVQMYKIVSSLPSKIVFDGTMNFGAFAKEVSKFLTQIEEQLECSRSNCTSVSCSRLLYVSL